MKTGLLFCLSTLLHAAVLKPVPSPQIPAAFEANRGQARADMLFLSRAEGLAITARGVFYSPYNLTFVLAGGNAAPQPRPSATLPGIAHVYTGADAGKWVTGIPQYSTIEVPEVWPGIDAQYVASASGTFLRLVCRPGCDLGQVRFELPGVDQMYMGLENALMVRLQQAKTGPYAIYPAPQAYQESPSGRVSAAAGYEILGADQFLRAEGFTVRVPRYDSALPLYIEMNIATFVPRPRYPDPGLPVVDGAGNTYITASIPDAAGNGAPIPNGRWNGCGTAIGSPLACTDVALYKFAPSGELAFAVYLAGRTNERMTALVLAEGRVPLLTGATDSNDFPITAAAFQPRYAGPEPRLESSYDVRGDFFAAKFDPATGGLVASTYAGGPDADALETSYAGPDGSVYLLPGHWISSKLPVTAGAIRPQCPEDPCSAKYVIRLDHSLGRAIYATYLPGVTFRTSLHTDGSLYFAGYSGPGFPVTPNAYQTRPIGGDDAFIARLDPSGSRLIFGTYFGTALTDWPGSMAIAPDGSVWASIGSFVNCCVDVDRKLIRLDAAGSRLLFSKSRGGSPLAVDPQGNLLMDADEPVPVTPDALASGGSGPEFVKVAPDGRILFATYLPEGYRFAGLSAAGNSVFQGYLEGAFELVPGAGGPGIAASVVNAANYDRSSPLSPGEIVAIFGSGLGPQNGVAFDAAAGRVPLELGGTRVLLDGLPMPILYSSYWQVNAIVPYNVGLDGRTLSLRVETAAGAIMEFRPLSAQPAGFAFFTLDGSGSGQAAALNEDGSVNSPRNPAMPGSIVTLFATGGGQTDPPSTAGEITPLEIRRLVENVTVFLGGTVPAKLEFAGAAPGLVAGVTQINFRLPETVPDFPNSPRSATPVFVKWGFNGIFATSTTIAVR